MAKVTFTNYRPAVVELEGQEVNIEVKRLTLAEFLPFEQKYLEYSRPMAGSDTATPEQLNARLHGVLEWLKDALTHFVRVPAGEVADADGADVTTGEALDALLAGHLEGKTAIANQIYAHNRFGEEVRKKLRSPSGSATTSDGQRPEAAGPKPEQIAVVAALPASAQIEDAPAAAAQMAVQSGETTTA